MTAFKRSQAKYVKGKCKITPESVFLNRNSTDSSLCTASTSNLAAHLDATFHGKYHPENRHVGPIDRLCFLLQLGNRRGRRHWDRHRRHSDNSARR